MNGRGVWLRVNGMCHVTPLRLSAGLASVFLYCALQEPNMTASGRRASRTAEAFLLGPIVCAT